MATTIPEEKSRTAKEASSEPSKQERLADALRQNLHRRKTQQRARSSGVGQRAPKT